MVKNTLLSVRTLYLKHVSVGLLALSVVACSDTDTSANSNSEQRRSPVAVYEVASRDLSRQFSVSASVEPRRVIQVHSRLHGAIAELQVEEGDTVARGDTLLQFDLQEERLQLARAQAQVEEAELELNRLQQLVDSQNVSEAELARAQARYDVAQAEFLLGQTRLQFGVVTAPEDAVVTRRYIELGEVVEAQQHMLELAAMHELVLRPGISERDIPFIQIGQSVDIQFDALPERQVEAQVRRIFPSADMHSRLVTVEVALPSDSFEQGIRPGFLARIALTVDPRPEAIAVPAASIGQGEHGHYVLVVEDERLVQRDVEVGATRGQWTEVVRGLERGELVLASNPIGMNEGTLVRIVGYRG